MTAIDLQAVGEIMRRVAMREAMPRWRNLAAGDISEKRGPDDIVTIADRAVEVALAHELAALLPASVVVGEEAVHADPGLVEKLRGDGQVWVIDPIDGTSAFARGETGFAVMVGLLVNQELQAGWILAPVSGELVCGRRGHGVWRSGSADSPLAPVPRPQPPSHLGAMRGITGRLKMSAAALERIHASASAFQSLTPAVCAGVEYPKLAKGEADFALYNKSEPWDHLPGLAIVAEQGFQYARHDGSPYRPGDNTGGLMIAPDRTSLAEIRAILIGD